MKRNRKLRMLAMAAVFMMAVQVPVFAEDYDAGYSDDYELSMDGLGADGLEPGEDGYNLSMDGLGADGLEPGEDGYDLSMDGLGADGLEPGEDDGYDWSDHPENWEDARGEEWEDEEPVVTDDDDYDWSDHPENWEGARGEEWEGSDPNGAVSGELPMENDRDWENLLNINVLANGADFEGLQNIQTVNFDDGSYFYEDLTEDGMTRIVNQSFVWIQWQNEEDADYITRIVTEVGGENVREMVIQADDELTERFGYPAYRAQWIYGANEDTRKCTAVMTNNREFTYLYYFDCAIDGFADMEEVYEEILQRLEFL